jgi:hypothetical protein
MTISGGQVDHYGLSEGSRGEQLVYVFAPGLAAAQDHESALRGPRQRNGVIKIRGRPGRGNDDGVECSGGEWRDRRVSLSDEFLMRVVLPDAR